MARWQRLYHEPVASLFGRGLYWRRFAAVREIRAHLCFLALDWPPGPGISLARVRIRNEGEEARVEEVNKFPTVERRRRPGLPSDQRKTGRGAGVQELGTALT